MQIHSPLLKPVGRSRSCSLAARSSGRGDMRRWGHGHKSNQDKSNLVEEAFQL